MPTIRKALTATGARPLTSGARVSAPSTGEYPDAELVFGLVYSLGTDREPIVSRLSDALLKYEYRRELFRLSDLVSTLKLGVELKSKPEADRIDSRIQACNKAREISGRNDFVSLMAVAEIARQRTQTESRAKPKPRTAYVLDSLKHPDEVATLRRIYGSGFFLIGIFATEEERQGYLVNRKAIDKACAQKLMARDAYEGLPYGQRTRDTYHLADVFVAGGSGHEEEIERFIDLVFAHPYLTPTQDEHAMFLAYGASLRSADLSRQVGAAISTERGDVVSVGWNDVPKAGGGLYGPGEEDQRDWKQGYDSNERRKEEIAKDIADTLLGETGREVSQEITAAFTNVFLRSSQLADVTEYGRSVHAEMEAVLSCARSGISPMKGTLYTTTFPCHNCARHIIAAGLKRVVYIEPYPKSYAAELHGDSILLEERETKKGNGESKVVFSPFVGVGPRRYFDLFSTRLSSGYSISRKQEGKTVPCPKGRDARPRVALQPVSYLQREQLATLEVESTIKILEKRDE